MKRNKTLSFKINNLMIKIITNTIMSKSKTVDILINEKEKSLHGKSASK